MCVLDLARLHRVCAFGIGIGIRIGIGIGIGIAVSILASMLHVGLCALAAPHPQVFVLFRVCSFSIEHVTTGLLCLSHLSIYRGASVARLLCVRARTCCCCCC